jgi:hypothetical protein
MATVIARRHPRINTPTELGDATREFTSVAKGNRHVPRHMVRLSYQYHRSENGQVPNNPMVVERHGRQATRAATRCAQGAAPMVHVGDVSGPARAHEHRTGARRRRQAV